MPMIQEGTLRCILTEPVGSIRENMAHFTHQAHTSVAGGAHTGVAGGTFWVYSYTVMGVHLVGEVARLPLLGDEARSGDSARPLGDRERVTSLVFLMKKGGHSTQPTSSHTPTSSHGPISSHG